MKNIVAVWDEIWCVGRRKLNILLDPPSSAHPAPLIKRDTDVHVKKLPVDKVYVLLYRLCFPDFVNCISLILLSVFDSLFDRW